MICNEKGTQSILFDKPPYIVSSGCIVGNKESEGPLGNLFDEYDKSDLFGREKDASFKGSIGNIYQSFDGNDVYKSLEEKAANLLYFVTKNHSFYDGNKRIAATMFLYFLDKNDALFYEGKKRIEDATLVALTIMIAESRAEEKEIMVSVVMNCIL